MIRVDSICSIRRAHSEYSHDFTNIFAFFSFFSPRLFVTKNSEDDTGSTKNEKIEQDIGAGEKVVNAYKVEFLPFAPENTNVADTG